MVVATATSRAEGELIAGFLRAGGVRAVVEAVEDPRYPTDAMRQVRVLVQAQDADKARDVLREADHVDAADSASDIDVGLSVDQDVRDYLAWRRETGEDSDDAGPAAERWAPAEPDVSGVPRAGQVPWWALLLAVAVVVLLVLALR